MAISSITLNRRLTTGPMTQVRREVAIQVITNYTTGGETVDLTTMLNPKKIAHGKFTGVANSLTALPASDSFYSVKTPNGFDAVLSRNSVSPTLKNMLLQFFTSGGTELGAGAYPAGLLGADVVFDVVTAGKYS